MSKRKFLFTKKEDVEDNLLFYLKFDGNANEEVSGNRLTSGTYHFFYKTGVNGKCGWFDAADSCRVQIPNTIWKNGPKKLKFDFYVSRYSNNGAGEPILSCWGNDSFSSSYQYYDVLLGTIGSYDILSLHIDGGRKEVFKITMANNKWYHIQIEIGTTIKCYVDGVLKGSNSITQYRYSDLYICYKYDTETYGSFLIDDFKIYDMT